jgi:hypothetical protein
VYTNSSQFAKKKQPRAHELITIFKKKNDLVYTNSSQFAKKKQPRVHEVITICMKTIYIFYGIVQEYKILFTLILKQQSQ